MSGPDRIVEKHELHVARRLIPLILGICAFLILISFMIGYFFGVKHATDEFITQIRHETLADQLLVSSTIYPYMPVTDGISNKQEEPSLQESKDTIVAETGTNHAQFISTESNTTDSNVEREILNVYNAELIGFGTKQAALEFIKRMNTDYAIPLELKERSSRTPRGKFITWYQVVTGKYEKKHELQVILDILVKREHLHDVKIVAYSATKKDLA